MYDKVVGSPEHELYLLELLIHGASKLKSQLEAQPTAIEREEAAPLYLLNVLMLGNILKQILPSYIVVLEPAAASSTAASSAAPTTGADGDDSRGSTKARGLRRFELHVINIYWIFLSRFLFDLMNNSLFVKTSRNCAEKVIPFIADFLSVARFTNFNFDYFDHYIDLCLFITNQDDGVILQKALANLFSEDTSVALSSHIIGYLCKKLQKQTGRRLLPGFLSTAKSLDLERKERMAEIEMRRRGVTEKEKDKQILKQMASR